MYGHPRLPWAVPFAQQPDWVIITLWTGAFSQADEWYCGHGERRGELREREREGGKKRRGESREGKYVDTGWREETW